jgi:hypothetical protein
MMITEQAKDALEVRKLKGALLLLLENNDLQAMTLMIMISAKANMVSQCLNHLTLMVEKCLSQKQSVSVK